MFQVRLRALADSSEDLQRIIRKLNTQIQEAEDIASSIRRMSEYDEVRRRLRQIIEKLETEKHQLMDMMAVLNQAQVMYYHCERSITDYGDQVRGSNYYRGMNVVQLDQIWNSIQDYHIR